jgi:arginyl-tRNA synthetase
MATASFDGLQAFVGQIGLEPIPGYAAANILNNPMDIYHSYLAEHFLALVECDRDIVYSSIQPANTVLNGDFDIVLPKLKLPGTSPKELAGKLLQKVSSICLNQISNLIQSLTSIF